MRSPSSAEYRKQYGNAVFARANSMLASSRRENPSLGRPRGRRQHRPSRVLRDLLGPGDPAARARHRLLRLVRGGAAVARWWRGRAVRPAGRACATSDPASRRNRDRPSRSSPPHHRAARPPAHPLDPGTAFRVWSAFELALLALAVWVAIRAGPWPLAFRAWPRAVTRSWRLGGGTYAFLLLGPDRRRGRSRSRRRLCLLAEGPAGAGRVSGWRSRSRRRSRTWRSGSGSGSSPGAPGALSRARQGAVPWPQRCHWRWSARPGSAASCRHWGLPPATRPPRARLVSPGSSRRGWERRRRSGARARRIAARTRRLLSCSGYDHASNRTLEVSLAGAAALSLRGRRPTSSPRSRDPGTGFAWCAARAAAPTPRPGPVSRPSG